MTRPKNFACRAENGSAVRAHVRRAAIVVALTEAGEGGLSTPQLMAVAGVEIDALMRHMAALRVAGVARCVRSAANTHYVLARYFDAAIARRDAMRDAARRGRERDRQRGKRMQHAELQRHRVLKVTQRVVPADKASELRPRGPTCVWDLGL